MEQHINKSCDTASIAAGTPDCLAYLITFRSYGTWLHGDERGAINRYNNHFGHPGLPVDDTMRARSAKLLKHDPIELSQTMRDSIVTTIREVCSYRKWLLHAVTVRSNHVHCVITAPQMPEKVMHDLKAWSTRRMREAGLIGVDTRLWERKGSTRYLWREASVQAACQYVIEGQGDGEL